MTRNRIKLLKEWKSNGILTYHIDQVQGSFKIDRANHKSLEFLRTCWIKKWETINQLKQANPEIISKIITISIGGMFVNYLSHPEILKENKEEMCTLLDEVVKGFYVELYKSLFLLSRTIQQTKNKC